MAELVNDMQRPLSSPCPVGGLGLRECGEPNYRSWRRVAIALRKTMIDADWSRPGSVALHAESINWLRGWVDTAEAGNVVIAGIETSDAIKEADPEVPETGRFPFDLAWYQGSITTSGWTFVEKTDQLVNYLKKGLQIYHDAVRAGAIRKKAAELERAEERPAPSRWIPIAVGVGVVAAVLAFGVWMYTSIVSARRMRRKAGM